MSYPSGPPGGYQNQPQQQGGSVFGRPPAAPNPLGRLGIPGLLTLGITVASLAAYFCSFGGGAGLEVWTLLAGGLLALLSLAPKAPDVLPFAGVLSVVGGLAMLDSVIASSGYLPTSAILILVFGLLQAVVAVVAVLLHYGMVKLAPRAAVPHNGGGGGDYQGGDYQGGGYQGGGGYNQPPTGSQQATTYMSPPPQQQPPAPQSTQFLQHPGQLNHPATPPGGNE